MRIIILLVIAFFCEYTFAFKKGINVNPWFTRPQRNVDQSYGWPPYPSFSKKSFLVDLRKIKATGFDFIRIPVTSEPLLRAESADRKLALENIRTVVDTALSEGLQIVFDLHPPTSGPGSYEELVKSKNGLDNWVELVADVSDIIVRKDYDNIIIEPMNEPTSPCTDKEWFKYQEILISNLRKKFPLVKYTVTSPCYSAATSFMQLNLAKFSEDKNIYATFHFYSPYVFTHQGASWTGHHGIKVMSGLTWPARLGSLEHTMKEVKKYAPQNFYYKKFGDGTLRMAELEAEKYYKSNPDEAEIMRLFEQVGAFVDKQNFSRHRVLLGEFGVLKRERRWNGAEMDSAARWITTVRRAAETNGFGWAMWSYKEGMALTIEEDSLEYHSDLVKALGLKQ